MSYVSPRVGVHRSKKMKLKKIFFICIFILISSLTFATEGSNKIQGRTTHEKRFSPEWVTAIASFISSISVVLLIIQISQSKKQKSDEYEIKRREKAVDIIMYWHEHLDEKNSLSRKFAETLDKKALKNIIDKKDFMIEDDSTNREYLKSIFNIDDNKINSFKKDGHILINSSFSTKLRWQLIEYLNLLEGVVSAWKYKVVDEELIEAEFKYMFKDENTALKSVRELFTNDYPCIDEFEETMKKKVNPKIPEKDKK